MVRHRNTDATNLLFLGWFRCLPLSWTISGAPPSASPQAGGCSGFAVRNEQLGPISISRF